MNRYCLYTLLWFVALTNGSRIAHKSADAKLARLISDLSGFRWKLQKTLPCLGLEEELPDISLIDKSSFAETNNKYRAHNYLRYFEG